jgi:hypothetical protein
MRQQEAVMKFSLSAPSKPLRRRVSHETFALLIAGLVAATQLAACKSAPVSHPGAAAASMRQSRTKAEGQPATQANRGAAQPAFSAQRMEANGLGEPVLLRPGAATDLILSATWCPACKQMDQVLRDPALAPYLRSRNLAFLFVNEHQMMEGTTEGPEAGEPRGDLRPYLLHPEVIRSLPGPAYLWTNPSTGHMQFPTILTANGSISELDWLMKGLGIPEETLALAFSRASAPRE